MKNEILAGLTIFTLASLLSACDQGTSAPDAQPVAAPPMIDEKNEVVPGTLFATFDPAAGYAAMQTAAKLACGEEAICKVVLFRPGTVLPTQFPMTDREVSEQIAGYTLNRNSGTDELIARCDVVKDTPVSSCMATE